MKIWCKLFDHNWNHFFTEGIHSCELRVCSNCGKTQELKKLSDGYWWVSLVQRTAYGFMKYLQENKIEIKK